MTQVAWLDITPEFDPVEYASLLEDEERTLIEGTEDLDEQLRLLYEWGYLSKRDGRIKFLAPVNEDDDVDEACGKPHGKKKKKKMNYESDEELEEANRREAMKAVGRELRSAAGRTYRGVRATGAGGKGIGKVGRAVRAVPKEAHLAYRELSKGAKRTVKGAAVAGGVAAAGLGARALYKRYKKKKAQREDLNDLDVAELLQDADELGFDLQSVDDLIEVLTTGEQLDLMDGDSVDEAYGKKAKEFFVGKKGFAPGAKTGQPGVRKAATRAFKAVKGAPSEIRKGAKGLYKAGKLYRGSEAAKAAAKVSALKHAKQLGKGAAIAGGVAAAGLAARAAYKKMRKRKQQKESLDYAGYRSSAGGGLFEAKTPVPFGTGNKLYEAKLAGGIKKLLKKTVQVSKVAAKHPVKAMAAKTAAGMSLDALKQRRAQLRQELSDSQEWAEGVLVIAESEGWQFDSEDDAVQFVDMFTEAYLDETYIGMGPVGTIRMEPQSPGPDSYPGLDVAAVDGQRAGPASGTLSADQTSAKGSGHDDDSKGTQTRGSDNFPALSKAHGDGQRNGPSSGTRSGEAQHPVKSPDVQVKAHTYEDPESGKKKMAKESLTELVYNSQAARRVRECVDMGRNPYPKEILEIAEREGFSFDNWDDVDSFMKVALSEQLYPSTGPTKHANQMKGDGFPALSSVSKEMQKLGPKDSTTGQNKTGARDPKKGSGTAPHVPYKKDAPKTDTQSENSKYKTCPVCNQKNVGVNAYCSACGAVLPARPEDKDGGIPVSGRHGGKRNWNVETDGGVPKVKSPHGGSKNKHYYLSKPPAPMRESGTPSSRVIIHDLLEANKRGFSKPLGEVEPLEETEIHHTPTDVHQYRVSTPTIEAVNSRASALGLNEIQQGELDKIVGYFQQGQNVGKAHLYSGVDVRLCQSVANMMGLGASHGVDRGMTNFVAPATLHPAAGGREPHNPY
jgi:hypothetical protein